MIADIEPRVITIVDFTVLDGVMVINLPADS